MKNGYKQHFDKMKKNQKTIPAPKIKPSSISKKNVDSFIKVKKKKAPPLGAILGSFLVLGFVYFTYWNYEKIEMLISKVELSILGQATAQSATNQENKLPTQTQNKEQTASSKSPEPKSQLAVNTPMTTEELALFRSLEDRKRKLDQRESELKKLEEELQVQKGELEKRLAELEQLRAKIANQLQERVTSDEEKVDKLVAFYSNMKPQQAAKIFETMNEDLAVEILLKMKKKEAAEIMNLVNAEKAKKLSEKFAGYIKN